jgi:hypothetical protein
MQLDFKARSFIVDAVEYRITWYEDQLRRDDLDEDQRSDLTNDLFYMRALLTDLRNPKRDLTSA